MKYKITICIVLTIHLGLLCQEIEPKLISSSGGYNLSGDVKLHWAIGEIAVNTHANDLILTEGFYQAYADAPTALLETNLGIDFSIYPNPVKNELTIDFDAEENLSLELYNILGQSILKIPLIESGMAINVTSINSGNYLAKMSNKQGQYAIYKIVKI